MPLTRRELIQSIAVTGAAMVVPGFGMAQTKPLTKPIPSSGEALPLVGLASVAIVDEDQLSLAIGRNGQPPRNSRKECIPCHTQRRL